VISAVTGTGLGPLLGHLATLVSEARASEATGLGEIVVHRPPRGRRRRADALGGLAGDRAPRRARRQLLGPDR